MKTTKRIRTVEDLTRAIQSQIQNRQSEKMPALTVSAGTCGRARGSLKVIESLKKALKKQELEDKVKIKVTGCHGFCEVEPNIIVQPQNIFYQKVQPKDAADIMSQTITKNEIIDRLLYSDPISEKNVLKEVDISFYKKQKRIILGDNALIDPNDINDYFSIGGYGSLTKVLGELTRMRSSR